MDAELVKTPELAVPARHAPPMARREPPPGLRALVEAATSLARGSTTARVALWALDGLLDPAAVPAELRARTTDLLDRAAAAAPAPLRARQVEQVLRRAWGRPPTRVLEELELDEPLAAGALGQVHGARLDGEAVTVEVRRPGLERAVRGDLALLDGLAAPLRSAFPALDAGAWLRAVRAQVLDELDLEHAASLQRRVARALRDVDGVVVPAVRGELAAPVVLVAQRLMGPTLAQERPADPAGVARVLLRAHLAAARAGVAPFDARPEHVVLLGGGRIGLLGAGAAAPIARRRVEAVLEALAAIGAGDAAALGRALDAELAVLGTPDAEVALTIARAVLGDLVDGPARLDAAALAAAGGRALEVGGALSRLARRATPAPEDGPLARMLGQLVLVLARLEASEDWVEVATRPTRPRARGARRSPRSAASPG
jgi:ABC1 atypical kinase-like domain